MAGSLNLVQLIGNVGKDPEIRSTQAGKKIANLSLATSEKWTDKSSGEQKERTEWHKICCFNEGLVGVIERFVKKGSKIYVSGQLQTRKWTDKDGVDRYSTEITLQAFNGQLILLDGRNAGENATPSAPAQQRPAAPAASSGPNWGAGELDDAIPF